MTPQTFEYIRKFLKDRSGISLTPDKQYLVDSRLIPLIRELNLSTVDDVAALLQKGADPSIAAKVVEAMTTNETSFFRDLKPFQQFETLVIPHIVKSGTDGKFDLWCAASSSGQEPYSLAMTFLEKNALLGGRAPRILGTDIDTSILKRAQEGIYTQFEVQRGLPITHLMRYFTQLKAGGDKWAIKDAVKQLVTYEQLNLLESYQRFGKFDVIFCRNVLIYFEPETKSSILNKLADALKPHGVLFLGGSESITDLTNRLQPFQGNRGVYELKK